VTQDPDPSGGPAVEKVGGDPVCWAHLLCPECGAIPDRPDQERCFRCGTELPARDD